MIGGCLCGKVRYEVAGKPAAVAVCHCTHCQKQTGSTFSLVVAVPREGLKVKGPIGIFHDTGDSGEPVLRRHCGECGSPIASDIAATPDLAWIKAGTLDDTSWLKPTMQIFCDSAQPWIHLEGLKSFPGMPEL